MLYKLGMVAFALSSLAAGLVSSMPAILTLRFVQGVASAAVQAAGPAIIADAVPPERRGRAYGITIGSIYAGLTLGPICAGFLVDLWGWRAVFLAGGALVLVLLMGANAIVTGILDIAMAIRLRKVIRGEWLLILTGIVSITFGVLVFLFPAAGALALVWLISFYAILTGVLLLALAWLIRKRAQGSWQGEPAGNQA